MFIGWKQKRNEKGLNSVKNDTRLDAKQSR